VVFFLDNLFVQRRGEFTLRPRVRTFTCQGCGLVLDRDEHAALNLAALVQRHVAQSGWEKKRTWSRP
jgi:transposase